jgi:hypothetical protein
LNTVRKCTFRKIDCGGRRRSILEIGCPATAAESVRPVQAATQEAVLTNFL